MISAKSGRDWSVNELDFFNITVELVDDPRDFFGLAELPPPGVPEVVLNHLTEPAEERLTKDERHFFKYLRDAMNPLNTGAATDDYAAFLLRFMDFDEPARVVHTHEILPFLMSGSWVQAETNVCIQTKKSTLLLIQEDKRLKEAPQDATAQLIAGAIGAFCQNNDIRSSIRQPPLEFMKIPGITMHGTSATFYQIPITGDLLRAVRRGETPAHQTRVRKFIPPVQRFGDYLAEGMNPLDNRRLVFQCFQAFKKLVVCTVHAPG